MMSHNRKFPTTLLIPVLLALMLAGLMPLNRAAAQDVQPGEAFLTRFSGTTEQDGRAVIDVNGTVGSIVDIRAPGAAPQGAHWAGEPQRLPVTAGQVGQVFGVAIDDASPPNIYLTATSAFGLHRNADNSDWMAGMWGAEGGPGTVWRLNAANGYQPEIFARVTLDGRPNSGAALGNIAYDRWNQQLYVSDLETGMIHRLQLTDGANLGHYDHGVQGRAAFFDAPNRRFDRLPEVPFDPATSARTDDCPSGDFARDPSCWNFADFRRRVWGLGVRRDPQSEEVRLYYALWSSQGFGHADFAGADDDEKRNAVWSVAIREGGEFDTGSVRREFLLPDFFRSPEAIARAGFSHPVSDIAFPAFGEQDIMLLAERGGVRNRGLAAEDSFAHPSEARVLRYELSGLGGWRAAGRYDVGYYDRGEAGPPYLRAGATGGVSFGTGYGENWDVDIAQPDAFVWMSGDGLCSEQGPCLDPGANDYTDTSQVDGIQGRAARPFDAFEPVNAFDPYPAPGPVSPPAGPDQSYMIDADADGDPSRNDATKIGDVEVFQTAPEAAPVEEQPVVEVLPGFPEGLPPGWPEDLPPEGWIPAPPPPDGWFPPPPLDLETDLAIEKTGPAECQEGTNCQYTITVRNDGDVPYVGPIAVRDTMPEGATFAMGPAGWDCGEAGGTVSCVTQAHAVLDPGAAAALALTFVLPADVAGDSVQDCAAIDWPEMGTDDGPGDGNEDVCIDTPVTEGFDLGLEKIGPADCYENYECGFLVTVTNHGPGEFNGVLAIRDTLPAGTTLIWGGHGFWEFSCTPAAGNQVRCVAPDIFLPPLASAEVAVLVRLPAGNVGGTYRNCAQIDWAAMGANDGDADANPDDSCHTVTVLDGTDFHDLAVTKRGPANCDAGGNCTYEVTVTNHGPDEYAGGLILRDEPPDDSAFVDASGPWACLPDPPNFNCSPPGVAHTLAPLESQTFDLTISIADPPPDDFVLNCIGLLWGTPGMPGDDNPPPGGIIGEKEDTGCIWTHIGGGFDLEIAKAPPDPAECYEGGVCDFSVTLTNNGPTWAPDGANITDTPPPGATVETISDAVGCISGAPGTITCTASGLPSTDSRTMTVSTRLPDPVVGDTVENCVSLDWDAPPPGGWVGSPFTGDTNAANDGPVCATVTVLAADLRPLGGSKCTLGERCELNVHIENTGGRLFKGAAGVRGTLSPAVNIASVKGLAQGLICSVTGNGTYECRSDELTLKPEEQVTVRLLLDIPADFPHRRIDHRKDMLWPDARVKDEKPENDRHTSTIWIAQPEEREVAPTPPPPGLAPAADLAIEKTARDASCTAGQPCGFTVTARNAGTVPYVGQLRLEEAAPAGARLTAATPRPWNCSGSGGRYTCTYPSVTLALGESRSVSLTFTTPRNAAGTLENCASADWTRVGRERARVYAAQQALNELGFPAGTPDGKAGSNTRKAVRAYQKSVGVAQTGRIDTALLRRLFGNWGEGDANAANDRSCARVELAAEELPPAVLPAPECDPGWHQVSAREAKVLASKGAPIRQVTRGGRTIFCTRAAPPPAEEAECPSGWQEVSRSRAKALVSQGYEIQQVEDIMCARPRPLSCPSGYTAYKDKNRIPANSEVVRRQAGNRVLFCAKPRAVSCPSGWQQVDRNRAKALVNQGYEIQQVQNILCARPRPLSCPSGYKSFTNSNQVPKGWEVVTRRAGNRVLYCAKARPVSCPSGWQQVDRNRAKALVNQGYEIQQVQNILCARPRPLSCPSGYRAYKSRNQVPKGWEVVTRRAGNRVLYCAKPQPLSCPSGYKTFTNRNQVPKGWQVITRRAGRLVIYCAKPGQSGQTTTPTPSGPSTVTPSPGQTTTPTLRINPQLLKKLPQIR